MRVPRAALGGAARTLLVFDLDGTLLDSLEDLAGSVNAVRRRHRLEVLAAEVVRDHIGDGAPALVARTLPEVIATGIPLEQLVEEFRADYRERCVIHPRLLPGARSLLDRARERGFTLALLSNKPVDMSLRILETLAIDRAFARILGPENARALKPDPGGLVGLLDDLRVAPGEAVLIGDSCKDFAAGRGAGVFTIGVRGGYASPGPPDPDLWVESLAEIEGLIEEGAGGGA